MARALRFDSTMFFNFATRADVLWRKEYFMDFVFGGDRDARAFGLTKITPEITVAYDVDGLRFLNYAIGSLVTGTVVTSDLIQLSTISCNVDGEIAGIRDAKIDTWEITVEEGNPVKAEFTAIGKDTTVAGPATYSSDFTSPVLMPSSCTIKIGTNTIDFSLFSMRVNNNIETIFKSGTVPSTLRPGGLEIGGRIRVPNYYYANVTDGSLTAQFGTIGTIVISTAKITEIPPRVTGYDLPETEFAWSGFPGGSGTPTVRAILGNTFLW